MRQIREQLRTFAFMSSKWWIATLAVAVCVACAVGNYVQGSVEIRDRLGSMSTVYVTTRDIAPGEVLTEESVRSAPFPVRFMPSAPPAPSPVGQRAGSQLSGGQPVLARDLSPSGSGPIAALLHDGERAVTISTRLPDGAVQAGDLAQVFASGSDSKPLVESSRVITMSGNLVTLAMSSEDASTLGPKATSNDLSVVVLAPNSVGASDARSIDPRSNG